MEDMLKAIENEIMEKEMSLSLAIYEYASLGNESLFRQINENAKKRWISLIANGIETGVFKKVCPEQAAECLLYYYQGLRMWSRVIPFEECTAEYYVKTIREMLLHENKTR